MKRSGVITLTTDFGSSDWYVGAMKGVILGINPRAEIVDLTHGVGRGDIMSAGFTLRSSYGYFPCGTVHAVVVDPGVGSERKIICTEWQGYVFIAPDNGVLWFCLGEAALRVARTVVRRSLRLERVSSTFHGRDIIAPAAAHLSKGLPVRRLGPPAGECVRLDFPAPDERKGGLLAEVIHVDHFGNLTTNVSEASPVLREPSGVSVTIRGKTISGISGSYQAVPAGRLLALCGSSGFLEIAVNGGSAAGKLGARRGTPLTVKWAQESGVRKRD